MLGRDDEQVRRALDAIEHTNTQALGDMRRLLAVLRDTEGDAATTPQPSLARLDDLVADVRESGLDVELVEVGEDRDVPPGVDLSAYRIVQEALTNVLKHASAGHATVRLDYGADELTLSVRDDGVGERGLERHRPRSGRDPGTGRGRRRRDRDRPGRRRRVRGQRPAPLLGGGVTVEIRVVIADDQPLVRAGLRMILDTEADVVVAGEATTGAEAVDLCERERPDVVLMDVRMPVMDGIEATRLITAVGRAAAGAGADHLRPRRGRLRRAAGGCQRLPAQGRARGTADHGDQGRRRGRFAVRAERHQAADRGVRQAPGRARRSRSTT